MSLVSEPVHSVLVNAIGPVPCPNDEEEVAILPACH